MQSLFGHSRSPWIHLSSTVSKCSRQQLPSSLYKIHRPFQNPFRSQFHSSSRWYATQQKPPRPRLSLLQRWARRPGFYYEIGGFGVIVAGFYVYNSERVPVSGRRRFNVVPVQYERRMGQAEYDSLMKQVQKDLFPQHHPNVMRIKRVLSRLVSGLDDLRRLDDEKLSGMGRSMVGSDEERDMVVQPHSEGDLDNWEVNVIESKEINAFVLPGNKVFFFSGILPICADDNGIATVLSHEIAHNVCHHAAEQMSSSLTTSLMWAGTLLLIGIPDIWTLMATDYMLSIAFRLPRSREMESEADQVGLRLMALSCYDPRAATTFWKRMEQAQLAKPPEFMSTHPSGETRIRQLGGWMDDAYKAYVEQSCPTQMNSLFRQAVGPWTQYVPY